MTSTTVPLKFQAGLLRAIAKAPYLATAIWNMHPVAVKGMGTLGVDKYWRIYYDPAILEVWDADMLSTVIIHEVWHLLRDHSGRAIAAGIGEAKTPENAYKHHTWNIAADCEINDDLTRDKSTQNLPEGHVLPKQFNLKPHKTVEYYYKKLFNKDEMDKFCQAVSQAGSGKGDEKQQSDPCAGGDGSGAGGEAAWYEVGKDGTDGDGDTIPSTEGGNAELVRQQTAHDVRKAIGKTPGFAERWAEARLNPKIDWRTQLQGAIRGALMQSAGRVDYSYARPSRRQSALPNIVLPTMRGPKPSITIGIDTSGSMSQSDLNDALAECKGIIDAVESKVSVFAVDSRASKKQKVYKTDEIKLVGGGGTDMNVGLRAAAEDHPDIAIIITDAYVPAWMPEKPPEIGKVVICVVGSSRWGNKTKSPDWATEIIINPEEQEG